MAAAAAPPEEIVFALTPATAIHGLLNFARTDHHKIYKQGIKAIETPFDCEADGLYQFLRDIRDRANQMGWMEGILSIDISEVEGVEDIQNLVENYGTLTLEQVTRWERTYIATPSRAAQDTYMLYTCLMSSLTATAKKKIMIWSDQYSIDVAGAKFDSGVALLKVIIRESHLDTNATTNSIRTKLSSLDTYIATVDSDIGKFNQYVKSLIQSLTARNQSTSDLLINLFKGYGAVSDEVFRAWLTRKQDDHEEGNSITPDELMLAAKNKFDAMVEKGTWNAPTAEEKIVALEAKVTSTIKNLNKKVSFEMGKKGAKGTTGKASNKGNKGGSSKGAKYKGGKEAPHPKTWDPPKASDKKEAEFEGHTWHWCGKETGGHCEKWRAHKPKECKALAPASENKPKRPYLDGKGKSNAKKLKIAKAYVAKLEQRTRENQDLDDDSA